MSFLFLVLQAELRSTLLQVEADKAALVNKVKAAEVGWLLLVAGRSSQACHSCGFDAVSSLAACALCRPCLHQAECGPACTLC